MPEQIERKDLDEQFTKPASHPYFVRSSSVENTLINDDLYSHRREPGIAVETKRRNLNSIKNLREIFIQSALNGDDDKNIDTYSYTSSDLGIGTEYSDCDTQPSFLTNSLTRSQYAKTKRRWSPSGTQTSFTDSLSEDSDYEDCQDISEGVSYDFSSDEGEAASTLSDDLFKYPVGGEQLPEVVEEDYPVAIPQVLEIDFKRQNRAKSLTKIFKSATLSHGNNIIHRHQDVNVNQRQCSSLKLVTKKRTFVDIFSTCPNDEVIEATQQQKHDRDTQRGSKPVEIVSIEVEPEICEVPETTEINHEDYTKANIRRTKRRANAKRRQRYRYSMSKCNQQESQFYGHPGINDAFSRSTETCIDTQTSSIEEAGISSAEYVYGSVSDDGVDTITGRTSSGPSRPLGIEQFDLEEPPWAKEYQRQLRKRRNKHIAAATGVILVVIMIAVVSALVIRQNLLDKKDLLHNTSNKTTIANDSNSLIANWTVTTQQPVPTTSSQFNQTIFLEYTGSARVTNLVYTADLSELNSTRAASIADPFCAQVELALSDQENFDRCKVHNFRNGSVIVEFELIFKYPLEEEPDSNQTSDQVDLPLEQSLQITEQLNHYLHSSNNTWVLDGVESTLEDVVPIVTYTSQPPETTTSALTSTQNASVTTSAIASVTNSSVTEPAEETTTPQTTTTTTVVTTTSITEMTTTTPLSIFTSPVTSVVTTQTAGLTINDSGEMNNITPTTTAADPTTTPLVTDEPTHIPSPTTQPGMPTTTISPPTTDTDGSIEENILEETTRALLPATVFTFPPTEPSDNSTSSTTDNAGSLQTMTDSVTTATSMQSSTDNYLTSPVSNTTTDWLSTNSSEAEVSVATLTSDPITTTVASAYDNETVVVTDGSSEEVVSTTSVPQNVTETVTVPSTSFAYSIGIDGNVTTDTDAQSTVTDSDENYSSLSTIPSELVTTPSNSNESSTYFALLTSNSTATSSAGDRNSTESSGSFSPTPASTSPALSGESEPTSTAAEVTSTISTTEDISIDINMTTVSPTTIKSIEKTTLMPDILTIVPQVPDWFPITTPTFPQGTEESVEVTTEAFVTDSPSSTTINSNSEEAIDLSIIHPASSNSTTNFSQITSNTSTTTASATTTAATTIPRNESVTANHSISISSPATQNFTTTAATEGTITSTATTVQHVSSPSTSTTTKTMASVTSGFTTTTTTETTTTTTAATTAAATTAASTTAASTTEATTTEAATTSTTPTTETTAIAATTTAATTAAATTTTATTAAATTKTEATTAATTTAAATTAATTTAGTTEAATATTEATTTAPTTTAAITTAAATIAAATTITTTLNKNILPIDNSSTISTNIPDTTIAGTAHSSTFTTPKTPSTTPTTTSHRVTVTSTSTDSPDTTPPSTTIPDDEPTTDTIVTSTDDPATSEITTTTPFTTVSDTPTTMLNNVSSSISTIIPTLPASAKTTAQPTTMVTTTEIDLETPSSTPELNTTLSPEVTEGVRIPDSACAVVGYSTTNCRQLVLQCPDDTQRVTQICPQGFVYSIGDFLRVADLSACTERNRIPLPPTISKTCLPSVRDAYLTAYCMPYEGTGVADQTIHRTQRCCNCNYFFNSLTQRCQHRHSDPTLQRDVVEQSSEAHGDTGSEK